MTFKEGNYSSEIEKPLKLKADVSIKDNKIHDVNLFDHNGKKIDSDLENAYRGEIISKQSVNIDGVSSASILTKAVKTAVGNALADACQRS